MTLQRAHSIEGSEQEGAVSRAETSFNEDTKPSTSERKDVVIQTRTRMQLNLKTTKNGSPIGNRPGTAAAKPSAKFDDTGLQMAATATREAIMTAIDQAKDEKEKGAEEKSALEAQQRSLYRVSTLVNRTLNNGEEMDINLTRAHDVLKLIDDKADILNELVIDLTHEETDEQHASTVGFVKLERGGVITKKDMQQYKRMYHEIESFSRRGTITLPAFRRYLAASCPSLVSESDRVSNTSMYNKLTRGLKEHFTLRDFMHFMYAKATRREIDLACSMVGEKEEQPHVQIAASVVREIAEIFRFWNVSGTGEISWDELKAHLLSMMSPLQVEEMLADARRYDDDHSNGLNFREFMFWWTAGGTEVDVGTLQEQRKQFQKARDPVHVLNNYVQSHSRGKSYKELHDAEDIKMMEHVRGYLAIKAAEEEAEREREREKERAKQREAELRKRLKAENDLAMQDLERRVKEMAAQGLRLDGTPMTAEELAEYNGSGGSSDGAQSIEMRLKMLLAKSDPNAGDKGGQGGESLLSMLGGIAAGATPLLAKAPSGSLQPTPIQKANPLTKDLALLKDLAHKNSMKMIATGAKSPQEFLSREASLTSVAGKGKKPRASVASVSGGGVPRASNSAASLQEDRSKKTIGSLVLARLTSSKNGQAQGAPVGEGSGGAGAVTGTGEPVPA